MRIHLIRHTRPNVPTGVCYGRSDIGLDKDFQADINTVNDKLLDSYDLVITSPSTRCKVLANSLNTDTVLEDLRLLEYDFGEWEMQHWDDLKGLQVDAWMEDYIHTSPPNGESLVSMRNRVFCFFDWLSQQQRNSIAIITHAGVIRLAHSWMFDIPLKNIVHLNLNYGDVIELKIDAEVGIKQWQFL